MMRHAVADFGVFSFMAGLSVAYAAWSVDEGLWLLFPVFVLCMLVAALGAWDAWRHTR